MTIWSEGIILFVYSTLTLACVVTAGRPVLLCGSCDGNILVTCPQKVHLLTCLTLSNITPPLLCLTDRTSHLEKMTPPTCSWVSDNFSTFLCYFKCTFCVCFHSLLLYRQHCKMYSLNLKKIFNTKKGKKKYLGMQVLINLYKDIGC